MAYKYGGGLENNTTKVALACYGGTIICAFLTMPLVKRRNYLCINQKAGLLMVPYVLWSAFYTYLTYSMSKTNTSEASERSAL
ncbi:unnamed protein product [Onchocerca flexuosa]|uniref:TspO/MBR family protein n=1 Tax=Onchocerca flexuosa TaxID=387005 RepID=A0A183I7X1_9BILA|nr:unnamed protein product [Onchocerca flexuosa]